jgi:Uma2 family endonuclease
MSATEYRRVPTGRRRFSVTDFHRMAETGIFGENDRVELLDGDLVDMAPIGPAHADVVDLITRALDRNGLGEACLLRVQNPVQLDDYSELCPDVAVVRHRRYRDAHPQPQDVLLIIEVSDRTLADDREVKAPAYAAHAIPELWIVNIPERCVEIYREPHIPERRYQNMQRVARGWVSMQQQPRVRLALSDLFSSREG